jgi:transposase
LDARERIAELEAALAESNARVRALEQQLERQAEQNAALTRQVEALTELLARNSRNSHLPPSSDPPGQAGNRGKDKQATRGKSKRKRGGQVGHSGTHRALVPAEQVTEHVDIFPQQCGNCWKALPRVPDAKARRYQVTEVPPLLPQVTEYRRHAVRCACGYRTRVPYEECQIPASAFGPRLMSLVALLTGVYHVSRRSCAQLLSDLLGVRLSLGAISAIEQRVSCALVPAVAQAWEQVERAEVKHTDGTGGH